MTIFLGIQFKQRKDNRKIIALLFISILFSVGVDIVKGTFTEAQVGMQRDLFIANTNAGTDNFLQISDNLIRSLHVFAGGQFGNIIILLLCIFWLVVSNLKEKHNVFIAVFFSLAVIPILFGNDLFQTRVLYDIPFQIPAALGLTYLLGRKNGVLIAVSISIWILALSIRAVTNFV